MLNEVTVSEWKEKNKNTFTMLLRVKIKWWNVGWHIATLSIGD
jgi:hypothetical protein